LRIIQVTDCHLQEAPDEVFKGSLPEERLCKVLEDIVGRNLQPDLLLLTGDLVHHGYPQGYQRLSEYVQKVDADIRWLPGNHDNARHMSVFSELSLLQWRKHDWCVVSLDSTSLPDGKGSGSLGECELQRLEAILQAPPSKYLLIALHHPPVHVGSPWQDAICLGDKDAFWRILEDSKSSVAKLIVCGHLHQDHEVYNLSPPLLVTPATAPQFKKATLQPVLETDEYLSLPGYRVIDLFESGEFSTQVVRVAI